MDGIDSALKYGLKVKINVVALKNFNENEFEKQIVKREMEI